MRNCRIEIHSNQVTIFLKWLYLNRFICTVLDVEKLLDGSEPETLEQNFPTIQEQSRHWSLNQEQNDAFILMAAALLQHINNTNQLSELEHIQSMISKIQKMNAYLDIILPTNRQLVMFLAGSGGTGKSHVIQYVSRILHGDGILLRQQL